MFSLVLVTDKILCLGAASPTLKRVAVRAFFHPGGVKGLWWFPATRAELQVRAAAAGAAAAPVPCEEPFIILVFRSELTGLSNKDHTHNLLFM